MKKHSLKFIGMAVVAAAVCIVFTCKNENKPVSPAMVRLDIPELTLQISGDKYQLKATVLPKEANQNVRWSSSSEAVADVDQGGLVTAIDAGECDITVTTENGEKTATCNVKVLKSGDHPVTGVEFEVTVMNAPMGQKIQLNAIVKPDNATNKAVKWKSSDNRIVTVNNNGVIEGMERGQAVVTVTTLEGNFTANLDVNVVVAVTDMRLNKTSMEVLVGRKHTLLSPLFFPIMDVDNKKIKWTSSHSDIASVDENGDITGIKVGETAITAVSDDGGFVSTCAVTVKADPYRKITGFLRSSSTGGKFLDDNGEVAIRGMGNIQNQSQFQLAADIGFNNVRYYMGSSNYPTGWTWTSFDNAVAWAKQYGMTLVLCMMTRPGTNTPDFFDNQDYLDRHVQFWEAVANRYKDEKAISAYELMNEPPMVAVDGEGPPFPLTFAKYGAHVQRLVTAIRAIDMNHNIMITHPWMDGYAPNDHDDSWRNFDGKFNYPDVTDPANNYTYLYNMYEPGRWCHQIREAQSGQPPRCTECTDCDRVYPSNTIAKNFVYDPVYGEPWKMTIDFLDYVYNIPVDHCRNTRNVPVYIGELGTMTCNFTNTSGGINRGARQYLLDLIDVLATYSISWSYHPFYVNEFTYDSTVRTQWINTMKEAFGTE